MITSRKISQVKVFAGSPWEVASVKSLLNAAYIQVSTKDNGLNSILISVPCEYYTAAMRVINNRKGSYCQQEFWLDNTVTSNSLPPDNKL